MVETLINTTTTSTPANILDVLNWFETLGVSQIFGMADTVILLFAFYGFNNPAKRWQFSFWVVFLGGLVYNVLFSQVPRQEIGTHFVFLAFTFVGAILIVSSKRQF